VKQIISKKQTANKKMLGLLFDPEDEVFVFFINGSEFLLDYMASHPRKQYASNIIKFFHKNYVINYKHYIYYMFSN
jgi:hypothetical protein